MGARTNRAELIKRWLGRRVQGAPGRVRRHPSVGTNREEFMPPGTGPRADIVELITDWHSRISQPNIKADRVRTGP